MRAKVILIPTLLVGAMTCAYAQEGPGGRFGGGGGPSIEAPGGGAGGRSLDRGPSGGDGVSARGPSASDGPGEGARGLNQGGPESRASRSDDAGERGAGRKSASDRGDEAPKARSERSADDDRGPGKSENAEKAAERAKSKSEEKADESQKRATTETQDRAREARESTPKADDAAKQSGDTARATPERAKQAQIASDKRDRVGAAFRDRHDVRHRTNIDISISVGRRLPRDWDYVPVPIGVVEIIPEYRGYVYVWVDDEYVIADPDTYEVVAVIPASSGGFASASGGQCPTRIRLSDDERDLILHSVRMRDPVEVENLDVGWSVPANIELETFPEPVLAEAEELSGCRYFVAEDQLAIVDPEADTVVLVIDRS